jgi:hypothetical protein
VKNVTKIIEHYGGYEKLANQPISIQVEGFMPLSIEQIGVGPRGGVLLSVMHWFEQNGDLMRDPDVVVEVFPQTGTWLALSYRQDSVGLMQEVAIGSDLSEKQKRAGERLARDIQKFLKQWDRNIGEQGFVEAAQKQSGRSTED